MSVKSFFFPKIALQGEEVPLHAIWKEIEYDIIRIDLSPFLQLKEVFNVAKADMKREQHCIMIKKLKVDGYLGILLESKQLEKPKQSASLSLTFLDKKGKMIERRLARILLFRPKIIMEDLPEEIKVDTNRGFVHNRIRMRNVGDGTAVVSFKTREDSQIERKLPENIHEFRKRFNDDIKRNLSGVQKEYPQYSSLVEQYVKLLGISLKGKQYVEEMQNVLEKLFKGLTENMDFGRAFIEAVGAAFLKNVHLITIFENFLQYLSSVASKKILVLDPLEVVPVSTIPKELAMNVMITDLIGGDYPEVSLPKVKIVSNQRGEVPIHRLFEWKRSDD